MIFLDINRDFDSKELGAADLNSMDRNRLREQFFGV